MVFLTALFQISIYAHLLIVQQEASPNSFKELGSLFLWGILGAIGVAILVVVVWLKIQSRRGESSANYVSINPSKHGEQS